MISMASPILAVSMSATSSSAVRLVAMEYANERLGMSRRCSSRWSRLPWPSRAVARFRR
jgi:hypothetical protein